MRISEFSVPEIGINVRSDGNIDYADLIVDGKKTLETRNSDSLRPYVGKRVSIVKTGKGRAYAIGMATIGEPIEVDEEKFRKLEKDHLVPPGSKFDINPGATKFLYPMISPKRYKRPKEVGLGIISRKVFAEDNEKTKNLAWRIKFNRFKDLDPLMSERKNKIYLMPFDFNALLTYSSLTGKDFVKIRYMPTEVYKISDDAKVGDMAIINKIFSTKDEKEKENLKKEYLNTMVPFSQYKEGTFKRPEILAEPNQIEKMNMSVYYDTSTGEIKAKQK